MHGNVAARRFVWDSVYPGIPDSPVTAVTVPDNRFTLEGKDLVIVEAGYTDTDASSAEELFNTQQTAVGYFDAMLDRYRIGSDAPSSGRQHRRCSAFANTPERTQSSSSPAACCNGRWTPDEGVGVHGCRHPRQRPRRRRESSSGETEAGSRHAPRRQSSWPAAQPH